jgi:ABC-type transport system involved in multi-copper enzyme maturation permease subunit
LKTLLIAQFTLREASRKKAVLGGLILTVVFLLLYAAGTYFAFRDINHNQLLSTAMKRSFSGELLLAGIYFVNFIAGLLAIFTSVGTISGEVEQGTLHAIVPKPLRRWEIVAGKWLGFAAIVAIYVIVTSAASIVIVYLQAGFLPPQPVEGVAIILLNAFLLLSLSMLGTITLSTVANGIIVFMLYAFALAGGRMQQLGTLIHNDTLINIGTVTSLIIPSDALWQLSAGMLGSGGIVTNTGTIQPGMFTVTNPPSVWMAAYAIVYAMVALGVGMLVFRRRDL